MRAFMVIRNAKEDLYADTIVLQNKKSGSQIQLEFDKSEWGKKGNRIEITLIGESKQSLIPNELQELGDNEYTYNYLRNCEVDYVNVSKEIDNVDKLKLEHLSILVSNKPIHFKCNNAKIY